MSNIFAALEANDAYLTGIGKTGQERAISYAKHDFLRKVIDNPGYEAHALRNGVEQRFLINRTDFTYKCSVVAFPDEDLFPGDILEFGGERWIVQQTRVTNVVQTSGVAWLCNCLFRFQIFSPEIHEYWGVLDSGVYSTSKTNDATVATLDMQYKIYLPENEDTRLLHEDQRLATDRWVDKNGDPILTCYAITGRDRISKSYGNGSHLLVLNARSSSYNSSKDNYELMICDYISGENTIKEPKHLMLKISGRDYMRIGSSRSYHATVFSHDVEVELPDVPIQWICDGDGVSIQSDGADVTVSIPDKRSMIGDIFTITASVPDSQCIPAVFRIEVVS